MIKIPLKIVSYKSFQDQCYLMVKEYKIHLIPFQFLVPDHWKSEISPSNYSHSVPSTHIHLACAIL